MLFKQALQTAINCSKQVIHCFLSKFKVCRWISNAKRFLKRILLKTLKCLLKGMCVCV